MGINSTKKVIIKENLMVIEYKGAVYEVPYDTEAIRFAVHEYASFLGRSRLFDYLNDRLIAIHLEVDGKELSIGLDSTHYEWNGECERKVVRYSYKPKILVDLETWNAMMDHHSVTCFGEKRKKHEQ